MKNRYYRRFMPQPVLPMLKHSVTLLAALAGFAIAPTALADDREPPLLVAEDGNDVGDCRDASRPCRTIDYALKRVGKNGQIRVAGGSYTLAELENVVYLLSGAIDVRGGYRASDSFAVRSGAETTLVGVPTEYAGELAQRGFRVIVDSKGMSREHVEKARALVASQQSVATSTAATPCAGGQAGAFPCSNVDLLAHVADRMASARGADIWGFVDLNSNREYAIVGYSTGTAIYDVTDPEDPREIDFIDGQSTTWRDIKVYQAWDTADSRWNAYAYITADNATDGLFIIDLSGLPHRVSQIGYASDFSAAHNVYLTHTDFGTGLSLTGDTPILVLAGSNRSDGRLRNYSLADPTSPAFIGTPATPAGQPGNDRLYMHDAASMIVTDSRKDTQCVNAAGSPYCEVLFDFNEGTVDIWDVTNPATPARLSRTPYTNADYVHSGWWSEDKQYMFVQDETDERDRGLRTTLRSFSISNLTAPTLAGTWTGPTSAIDHNGFVRGNRYYMSNYARGLTILDISDPASPTLAGRFDTYPSSDGVGFPGAWGTYPFLPSGNVLISDIDSGLYVVADRTLDVPQGSIGFSGRSFGADESGPASLVVSRSGGSQGATVGSWEILGATANAADVAATSGTLSWADGDGADKTIDLGLVNDGSGEGLERLFVRLTAPTGGATLRSPNIASLYVSDPGNTATVQFAESSASVAERGFGTAVVVVQRGGSALGAVTVDCSISGGDATNGTDYSGPQSGTLSWPDGDANPKSIEFAISDDGSSEPDEFFEVTLGNVSGAALGSRAVLRVDILDGSGSNAAPNSVAGGSQTVRPGATVTLNGSQSNDPDGDTLSYAWTQVLGPTVTLSGADTATATFTAPDASSDTLLRFELAVSDPGGLTDTSVVSVTVSNSTSVPGGGSGGGTTSAWLLAALFLLLLRRRLFERMRLDDGLFAVRTR